MSTSTIPALEAGESRAERRKKRRSERRHARNSPEVIKKRWERGLTGIVVATWFLITVLFATISIAASESEWKQIEEGIPAVALEDSRYTNDYGQVAKMTYQYDGVERTEVAEAAGTTLAGDEVEIAVMRETGEPTYVFPRPVWSNIIFAFLFGIGGGVIAMILCLFVANVKGLLDD